MPNTINPDRLDHGIRDAVVLLQRGGFRTFTSCEGGRGHAFQYETIGIELDGNYSTFQQRLVRFLRSHGIEHFTISLVTDYHPDYPEGKQCVYLGGLDILSETKRKQVIDTAKRREWLLRRELEKLVRFREFIDNKEQVL
jgi:hypothetical protein